MLLNIDMKHSITRRQFRRRLKFYLARRKAYAQQAIDYGAFHPPLNIFEFNELCGIRDAGKWNDYRGEFIPFAKFYKRGH